MRSLGIRPARRLSQSFLRRTSVAHAMVAAAEIEPSDTAFEIGPGLGILTVGLVQQAARVVAVELDRTLAAALPAALGSPANLAVVHADALSVDLGRLVATPFVVVASLPYHVATAILSRLLAGTPRPRRIVAMVQAEVADRIAARGGAHSYLDIAFSAVARARIVQRVPPQSFFPVPKVGSAVVRLDLLAEPAVPDEAMGDFLAFVRAGFCQPRQQLHNSLGRGLGVPSAAARAIADQAGIDPSLRPGALGLPEWLALFGASGARAQAG